MKTTAAPLKMIRLIAIPLLGGLATTPLQGSELPEALERAIGAGDWPSVATAAEAWQAETGDDRAMALYWRGHAALQRGSRFEAATLLRQSLATKPTAAAARSAVRAEVDLGNVGHVRQLMSAWPGEYEVHYHAGVFFFGRGLTLAKKADPASAGEGVAMLLEARAALETAVASKPEDAAARYALAKLLDVFAEEPEALHHMEQAASTGVLYSLGLSEMASLQSALGNHRAAAEVAGEASLVSPIYDMDFPSRFRKEFYAVRQISYLERAGDHAAVAEALRQALWRTPNERGLRLRLGKAAYRAGDYRLALFAFGESYRLESDPRAAAGMALCLVDLEQFAAAKLAVGRAFALADQHKIKPGADAYYVRGRCVWHSGDKLEAARDLYKAHALRPGDRRFAEWSLHAAIETDDALGAVGVARSFGLNGHADEAIEALKAVPQRWPKPKTKSPLGHGYPFGSTALAKFAIGDIERARGNYRSAYAAYKSGGLGGFNVNGRHEAWCALHAGEAKAAADLFAIFTMNLKATTRDPALYGQAVAALHAGDVERARKAISGVSAGSHIEDQAAALRAWMGGSGTTADRPIFDRLGLSGTSFAGSGIFTKGLRVETVLPGSPLEGAAVQIRPGDRLVLVGGRPLHDVACMRALRSSEGVGGETSLRFYRPGEGPFELTVEID